MVKSAMKFESMSVCAKHERGVASGSLDRLSGQSRHATRQAMNLLSSLSDKNGGEASRETLRIERVLLPVDFSVCTLETLQYAGAVAQKFHSMVNLLHVIPISISRKAEGAMDPTLTHSMSEGARKELNHLAEILWAGEITTTVTIREGQPADVILQEAATLKADLIVMGKRSRSWLSRFWQHHTVRHVIQHAQCPVIVLRAGVKMRRKNKWFPPPFK
jgi:nucleotide-binding universal stress UspA family protein